MRAKNTGQEESVITVMKLIIQLLPPILVFNMDTNIGTILSITKTEVYSSIYWIVLMNMELSFMVNLQVV